MKLARLNNGGIREFASYLSRMRESSAESPPLSLLDHEAYSDPTPFDHTMPTDMPATRYELGAMLVKALEPYDQTSILRDTGLWAWLALYYIEGICPVGKDGRLKVARQDNYILSTRRNDVNRHAIRTPYLLVKLHGEWVKYMLSSPINVRGEFTEQLTGRPYFVNCHGIVQAAHALYADPNRGTFKHGAASKRGGTVRRFGLVVRQLELTYDVIDLDGATIVSLLPREFDRFRN